MKFTLFFLNFALSVAFFAYADEAIMECFNKERIELEWMPFKEECKAKIIETEHVERIKLVTLCVFQKKGLLSEDMVLDYPKLKDITLDTAQKDEIEHGMQDCWNNKESHNHATVSFFLCAREKLVELCSVTTEWEKSI